MAYNAVHPNTNFHSPAHQSKLKIKPEKLNPIFLSEFNHNFSAMTVNVDQCVYGGDEVKLSFEDESCGFAAKNGNTWTLSTALDGCGTDVSNSEDKIR